MKLTRDQFLNQPRKAITLIGMSGSGKTHLSSTLASQGWHHYSCDYEIGMKFLRNELSGPVTHKDLSTLSAFVGQVGNPELGGLPLAEFKRRQDLYYRAECQSLENLADEMKWTAANFLNDSTGSLCEITDTALIDRVGEKTLFIYRIISAEDEIRLIERAAANPKPLFFPPAHFDGWLAEYMEEHKVSAVEQIVPNEFSRWVFPRLFRSRLPKYQALADRYGVTIPSAVLKHVYSEPSFYDAVVEALPA